MTPVTGRRLFLVDGYALIYRSFFAFGDNQLINSRGENTTIARGAVEFLRRLLERHSPDALAWVHDAGLSFRHEIFPGYKATRERLEPSQQADFDTGVERVGEILDGYRIRVLELDGFEADDVIGTLAQQARAAGVETVIVSGDKDFMQLIGPGVTVLNPWHGRPGSTTEKWYDQTNAHERLGVPPERVVDYLGLLGDTSDNVPGVRGIGDKTARALIGRWGTIETMLEHLSEVEPKRARTALEQHAADALLSKKLVTIRTDLPLQVDVGELAVREPDWARLRDLFVALEFRQPAQEAAGRAEAANNAQQEQLDVGSAGKQDRTMHETIGSVDRLPAIIAAIRAAGAMSVTCLGASDVGAPEGRKPLRERLLGLAVASGEGRAFYFPIRHGQPGLDALALGMDGAAAGSMQEPGRNLPGLDTAAMSALRALLENPHIAKIGHDLKYDLLLLRREGVSLRGISFDSMLASYLLDPGRRSHALDAVAVEFLQRSVPAFEDLVGKGKRRISLSEVSLERAAEYACAAANVNWALREALGPRLEDAGAARLLRDVELPLESVLAEMEWTGICIDIEWFRILKQRFASDRAAAEEAIYAIAGERFNINSNRQMAAILFERMGLPVTKKTSTGPSTDASVLQQLADEGHELPARILEYRELAKLESTYLDALPALVNPDTGRLHTSYDQAVTATGRLSSSEPNLQNIPIRREMGRDIRRGFVPRARWKLLTADYSQIELRLLAHLSGDPAFVDAFASDGDIHRQTAAIIFGTPVDAVTPEMRARAKTINFATIYGQGAHALSRQLRVDHAEAKAFIEMYFTRFSGVRRFLDTTIQGARERGYVETILGRRRYVPELKDRNFNIRAFGERTAQNSPIQGSAADLIKVAMLCVDAAMQAARLEARMLLQVHDELVFEAPPSELDALEEMVRVAMTTAITLRVPLVVDIGIGDNWLDAKR